ncbi:MAG: hypothetical protein IJ202_04720 [Bacteroidales bacterium]|nr:hypothetical protein [Bacteroidales bacterium]
MMERLYLSSGVRLEWKGLDPTDEGQRKKAAKSLLGRVNWKGTYQSSCDLAATRTEQFCEEMNVPKEIVTNLLLAARGKGGVSFPDFG